MITLTIVMLIFSGLFSGVEIAYVTSDRVRMQLDAERGGIISRIVERFYTHSQMFFSTVLVGNNVVLVVYGIGMGALLTPWIKTFTADNEALLLVVQTLISTLIILLTGEFLPKTIFRINPNSYLRFFAIPVWLIYILLYPVSWGTTKLSALLMRMAGVKDEEDSPTRLSVADLSQFLDRTIDAVQRDEDDAPVENEVKIFHNALDFSTIHLRDCMSPRNDIVAVDIDDTDRAQLSNLFTRSGRSKILVYREDIDNIIGYIHVSELFDPDVDWKTKVKPVIYAPEALLAQKMMKRLLAEKRSMAVVIDEFGGTAGLVTLEDLVEEIFGDIRDEHDKAQEKIRRLADGAFEIPGRAEIETIRDECHIDIPEDSEYQTLAGYILTKTGYIPKQGESVDIDGLRFTIVRAAATRLELIRVDTNSTDKQ